MQSTVEFIISQSSSADWFSRIGKRDLDSCDFASSWEEAIDKLETSNRIAASTESRNILNRIVHRRYMTQLGDKFKAAKAWQEFTSNHSSIYIAAEVGAKSLAKTTNFDSVVRKIKLPPEVKDVFIDDVTLIIAFREIFGECSHFYAEEFEFFLKGHFPCGYVGEYRKGKFIIY